MTKDAGTKRDGIYSSGVRPGSNNGQCRKCGARRIDQQIGLEDTPDEFVARLVEVFREVRRILHPTGVLFLNLGDSYASNGERSNNNGTGKSGLKRNVINEDSRQQCLADNKVFRGKLGRIDHGLKPKDLIGIPWMVAFALRADGWYLRQEIIWHKLAPMPECLDPETTIFVRNNGWVSKITLGQLADIFDAGKRLPEILSPDGWVEIKNVWRTMKPAMAIEAGKVERVICSPEHRFPVSSDRRRIRVRHEEAQNIRHEGYADYLLYCPIDKFLTPTITHWSGRELDYSLGYLIGAYTAEGGRGGERGYRIKLTIGIDESQFAENIRRSLKALSIEAAESEDVNVRYFQFSEEWLNRTIASFVSGDVRTKMLNVELLLNCPREFRQGILDGYVEGDGSDRKGGGWITTSASRRLRDDVSTLASSLGIVTSKGSNTQHDARTGETYYSSTLWTPYMTKRQSKSGMEGIYQVPPRSRRMLDGEREMIDIEVEGHIFIIGDGLLTHNSVQDRCTKAHEQVFMLAKSERYFYDAEAIREPMAESSIVRQQSGRNDFYGWNRKHDPRDERQNGFRHEADAFDVARGANKRSVWTLGPESYAGAHYATMPTKLVEPCVLAGSSQRGCCAKCGAPWQRDIERVANYEKRQDRGQPNGKPPQVDSSGWRPATVTDNGWEPTCFCQADVQPCTVLDPFFGSGTVGAVALKHGRRFVGIDLDDRNMALAHDRIARMQPLLLEVTP